MTVEKYDAITGERLDKKKDIPMEFYLVIGIIATLIIPAIGFVAGLYAILKNKPAEGVILLFVGLISWMLYMYGVL